MVRRSAALLCALAACCAPSSTSVLALQAVASASSGANDAAGGGGVVGAANSTATAATTGDLIGWFDCSTVTFAGELEAVANSGTKTSSLPTAQCARYKAPLCHSGICEDTKKRTVDVFVKRVLARDQPDTKPNVWFLPGGPGAASSTVELVMASLYEELGRNVNVYTMDHRGTGRSTLLDCVAAQATTSGSPLGASIDISEFAACAQELQSMYGDMAAFSVTSAATDIASFIAKYQPGSKTFVYGVSYGSALVERLIHLNTTEIVGYILDGVATTSGAAVSDGMYMSNWDTNFGEVADRFLDLLKTNAPATTSKFGSKSVASVLKSALASVDKSPSSRCAKVLTSFYDPAGTAPTTTKPSHYMRQFLGRLLMSTISREYIPVVIYRLERCSEDDVEVLAYALKALTKILSAPSEEEVLVSMLEYYLIVFSEMWEDPTPSYDTLLTRFTNASIGSGNTAAILPLYCAFTKDASAACAAYARSANYTAAPLAYKKDKYWNVAATIPPQASVLILSGKLDPQTPHKYAERLFKAMDGAKKELVAFEYAPHGTLFTATYSGKQDSNGFVISPPRYCAVELLASYVDGNADLGKLNKTCVALTNTYMSLLDANQLYEYTILGTDRNMFDGGLDNYAYSWKLETPLIAVSVAGGFFAVCLLIYVCTQVSNRRAARAAEQWRGAHADTGVAASPTTTTSFLPGGGTAASSNAPAETRV